MAPHCKGICRGDGAAERIGYRVRPITTRVWHYLDGRLVCAHCMVAMYGVPDSVARCPCCGSYLRRNHWQNGRPTGRAKRAARCRAKHGAIPLADTPPRNCGECGRRFKPDRPQNFYCRPECTEAARVRIHRRINAEWRSRQPDREFRARRAAQARRRRALDKLARAAEDAAIAALTGRPACLPA